MIYDHCLLRITICAAGLTGSGGVEQLGFKEGEDDRHLQLKGAYGQLLAQFIHLADEQSSEEVREHVGKCREGEMRKQKHTMCTAQCYPQPSPSTCRHHILTLPIPHLQTARTRPDCRLHSDFQRDPTLVSHAL